MGKITTKKEIFNDMRDIDFGKSMYNDTKLMVLNWMLEKVYDQGFSKTAKGYELVFISSIKKDGSGTIDLTNTDMSHLNDTVFVLNSLSITDKTFIACEFNSYVVRLVHCD